MLREPTTDPNIQVEKISGPHFPPFVRRAFSFLLVGFVALYLALFLRYRMEKAFGLVPCYSSPGILVPTPSDSSSTHLPGLEKSAAHRR